MAFYAFKPEPPEPRTTTFPETDGEPDLSGWWFTPEGQVVMEVLWRFPEARDEVLKGCRELEENASGPSTDPPDTA